LSSLRDRGAVIANWGAIIFAPPNRLLPEPSLSPVRTPSIGLILSVVLAAAAGCGAVEGDSGTANDGGATPPATRNRAIAIAVGRLHTCALLEDHHVKCWGDNSSGELGLGDLKDRGDPTTMGDNLPTVDLGTGRTAKSLTAGVYSTCAILDDDEVKCWGREFFATPNPTEGNLGDEPGEMGDHLKPIDLGPARRPVAVAIGFGETCVSLDDGSSLCWSGGPSTKMATVGDDARVVQLACAPFAVALFDDGSVRQVSSTWPSGLKPIDLSGGQASFLTGSRMGYCAVLRGGGTPCTFDASIPSPPTDASVVALAVTEDGHACALDSAGAVRCWPSLSTGAPPSATPIDQDTALVQLGQPATALGAGDYTVCALLADGSVKCWAIDGVFAAALGGSVATSTAWPAVDLGTRPAR